MVLVRDKRFFFEKKVSNCKPRRCLQSDINHVLINVNFYFFSFLWKHTIDYLTWFAEGRELVFEEDLPRRNSASSPELERIIIVKYLCTSELTARKLDYVHLKYADVIQIPTKKFPSIFLIQHKHKILKSICSSILHPLSFLTTLTLSRLSLLVTQNDQPLFW